MAEVADAELVRRATTRDDRHAFATLVRRYQSEIRASLRRMCHGDLARADDLAQETFIKAYRYLRGFKHNSSFRTWLYRIAINHYLNDEKQSRREREAKTAAALQISEDPSGESLTDAIARERELERILLQLSATQRVMVDLNLQRGFSHQEIVEITGIPLGTVKSHLRRARDKLQSLLLQPTGG